MWITYYGTRKAVDQDAPNRKAGPAVDDLGKQANIAAREALIYRAKL